MRGRHEFILRARLAPIGVPLATVAAVAAGTQGRRSRRAERALGAALLAFGAVYLEGVIEYEFRRAAWRRAELAERRRRREVWREQTGT